VGSNTALATVHHPHFRHIVDATTAPLVLVMPLMFIPDTRSENAAIILSRSVILSAVFYRRETCLSRGEDK
jgi:hypothetical protein